MRNAWLFCVAMGFAPAAYAEPLSFAGAIERAASQSPLIAARAAALEAAEREVGPAGALPDPELVLALENVPATGPDQYRLNSDDMTMQRIGVMQEMPSFAELSARRAAARAEAERAGAGVELGRLEARLGAANAWIGLYFAERRASVLRRLVTEARAGAEAARARLGAGAGAVDDAIAAEVEAARIEDRVAEADAEALAMRAELRRWLGHGGNEPLADEAPRFVIDGAVLREHLRRHPALAAYDAEEAVAEAGLRVARAERWPDWSWELSYGRRDPRLEDMASLEVRVGLPLFQPWRQGPIVAARRADVSRVGAEREAALREHEAILEAGLARYAALTSSAERSRIVRLPRARERAAAAEGAFGAGSIDAGVMIGARREAMEAEIEALDLEERLTLTGAVLALQYGGSRP